MPVTTSDTLGATVVVELLAIDQLLRSRVTKALPHGMEISHLTVLNYLAATMGERTPAQLAARFRLTRGAMTNTINKLDLMGFVHVRPDWDDARRKLVSISGAGRAARDEAVRKITPLVNQMVEDVGHDKISRTLPILREMRQKLADD